MVPIGYPVYVSVLEPEDSRCDFRRASLDISESIPR